jgi:hypothetical protein
VPGSPQASRCCASFYEESRVSNSFRWVKKSCSSETPRHPRPYYFRIADNPEVISFCLNVELHAKIAK